MEKQRIPVVFLLLPVILCAAVLFAACIGNDAGGEVALSNFDNALFESLTVTYNGNEHALAVKNIPEGTQITYADNKGTNAGTYNATVDLHKNGYTPKRLTAVLEIQKANIAGVAFADSAVQHDGVLKNIEVSGKVPDGVTVAYTHNGSAFAGASAIGVYEITATLSGANYNTLILTAKLSINDGTPVVSEVWAKIIDDTYAALTKADANFKIEYTQGTPLSGGGAFLVVDGGKAYVDKEGYFSVADKFYVYGFSDTVDGGVYKSDMTTMHGLPDGVGKTIADLYFYDTSPNSYGLPSFKYDGLLGFLSLKKQAESIRFNDGVYTYRQSESAEFAYTLTDGILTGGEMRSSDGAKAFSVIYGNQSVSLPESAWLTPKPDTPQNLILGESGLLEWDYVDGAPFYYVCLFSNGLPVFSTMAEGAHVNRAC